MSSCESSWLYDCFVLYWCQSTGKTQINSPDATLGASYTFAREMVDPR